jgi:hypothetical protein
MPRALVLLLLLANAAFFAWWQGWLAPVLPPPTDAREPERLAAQLRPEAVTVLTPSAARSAMTAAQGAASAASAPAPAPAPADAAAPQCLEAGPFSEGALASAEAFLSRQGVPASAIAREAAWNRQIWGVVIARLPDRDAVRAKAAELRRLGVPSVEISAPPALAPGLRLDSYTDRYGAETALANLSKKGVRGARVAPLPSGVPLWWLRAARADDAMQARLKALPAERLRGGFKPCAARD